MIITFTRMRKSTATFQTGSTWPHLSPTCYCVGCLTTPPKGCIHAYVLCMLMTRDDKGEPPLACIRVASPSDHTATRNALSKMHLVFERPKSWNSVYPGMMPENCST